MALYPNGRYMTSSPGRHFGPAPGLDTATRNRGDRWNRFLSGMAQTTTTPEGYGMRTPWAPIKAGGLAGKGSFAFSLTGNALAGGPMTGAGSFALTAPDASLSMIASLTGSGSWSLVKGIADLSGVVTLTGSGAMSINGQGNLGATVPMSGSGAWSLTGTGDLRMKLSLTGGWTPYTTLSPENLAANVWGALATSFNEVGTMGAKLNTASSGGVDLNALAAAVHQYAVEGGYTFEEVTRIMAAALAGTSQKTGATIVFTGLDGATERITGSFDVENNRTGVILDGG